MNSNGIGDGQADISPAFILMAPISPIRSGPPRGYEHLAHHSLGLHLLSIGMILPFGGDVLGCNAFTRLGLAIILFRASFGCAKLSATITRD